MHTRSISRQRIAAIEEQLRTHDLLWFVALPASFWAPQTELFEALEELKMLKGLIDEQRANVLHLAKVWASMETKEADLVEDNLNRCKLD